MYIIELQLHFKMQESTPSPNIPHFREWESPPCKVNGVLIALKFVIRRGRCKWGMYDTVVSMKQ